MINKDKLRIVKGNLEYHNEWGERDALDIDEVLECISELEAEYKRLEEINAEHQRINGELQKKLTKAEEIIKGKSIQELGVSKLYKDIDSITGGNPYPDFNKED